LRYRRQYLLARMKDVEGEIRKSPGFIPLTPIFIGGLSPTINP
jgi:hypothetical protein